MFKAPINNLVVTVETKYVKNFTSILRMAAIQNGSSVDPSDYVNIMGKVVSVPKAISDRREYAGFSAHDILPGDTAIFSHEVIYSFSQVEPDAEPIYKNSVWYNGTEYFVAVTKKGAIVALEWKGGDRISNEDTQYKVEIGETWEKLGGSKLRFFLVHTGNVEEILKEIKEL
jgi:hypothetical protein